MAFVAYQGDIVIENERNAYERCINVVDMKKKIFWVIGIFLFLSFSLFLSMKYEIHFPSFLPLNVINIVSRIVLLVVLIYGWYKYTKDKKKYSLILLIFASLLCIYYIYMQDILTLYHNGCFHKRKHPYFILEHFLLYANL